MTDTSREALIKMLIECLAGPAALTTREATAIKDAADMLEADARDTAWQRGFQSGVSSNDKTAKDAVAALASEQAAHRETNRLMTEALMQEEAQQVAVPQVYKAMKMEGKQHDTGRVYTGEGSFFADTASLKDALLIANALNSALISQGEKP